MIPSAPRIQLIGAMFAPAQIQNCCHGVEVAILRADRLDAVHVELDGLRQLVSRLLHRCPPVDAKRTPGFSASRRTDGRTCRLLGESPSSTSTGVSTRRSVAGSVLRLLRDLAAVRELDVARLERVLDQRGAASRRGPAARRGTGGR